jgi:hypothetical protein
LEEPGSYGEPAWETSDPFGLAVRSSIEPRLTDCPLRRVWVVSAGMKINVEIDCTPEEARAFFGLPDVAPMQERLMKEVEERMVAAMHAMEPDALVKTWLPASMQGFENLQKLFWNAMGDPKKK